MIDKKTEDILPTEKVEDAIAKKVQNFISDEKVIGIIEGKLQEAVETQDFGDLATAKANNTVDELNSAKEKELEEQLQEMREWELRKNNVIIHNIKEPLSQDDVISTIRLGKKKVDEEGIPVTDR